mgnify:CR=1 FL=1
MSMLNRGGDVFTLLGIQDEVEEKGQQRDLYDCGAEINLLERKRGGMVPHFQHVDDYSAVERLQNI